MSEGLRVTSRKDGCAHRLGFPFHTDGNGPQRLNDIARYVEESSIEPDYFSSGEATKTLERKIADILGTEAAVWCPTGTMAQGIAAKIYSGRSGNNTLLLHPTSHLLLHEFDGYSFAHGLRARAIGDVRKPVLADDLVEDAACAFIELPQRHNGGSLPSWAALDQLKGRAQSLDLPLHMDGARLWSCRPHFDGRSYRDISHGFSSVYVSLYKDIGAIGGATLAGDEAFVEEARIWKVRLGGLVAESWPTVCDALRLLDKRASQMDAFVEHAKVMAIAVREAAGNRIVPETPQTNMFHIELPYGVTETETRRDMIARKLGVWIGDRIWEGSQEDRCRLEVQVGENAQAIPLAQLSAAFAMLTD
jgi:threonine aldolase